MDFLRKLFGFKNNQQERPEMSEVVAETITPPKELFIDEGIEVANFGIYEIDLVENKWKMSQIVNELFGVADDTVWDFDFFIDTIIEKHRDGMRKFFSNLILEKKAEFSTQYQIKRKDNGEIRWIEGKGKLFYNESERAYKIIGTNIDVTEYKALEVETLIENKFLITLLKAIPDFVFDFHAHP